MARSQEKLPKGGKNVQRGNRHHVRTQNMRSVHIQNARKKHLKNALRSCGAEFAEELRLHYARIGLMSAPQKHSRAQSES